MSTRDPIWKQAMRPLVAFAAWVPAVLCVVAYGLWASTQPQIVPRWTVYAALGVAVAITLPWLFVIIRLAGRLEPPDPPADHPLCRVCGYDLRATPDRCPECGTPAPRSDARTTDP